MAAQIDEEVKRIIDEGYGRCEEILKGYTAKMHEIAAYLLRNETMDGETFRKVMEEGEAPRDGEDAPDPEAAGEAEP